MPRSTQLRDFEKQISVSRSIAPAGNRTATINGTGVDTKEHLRTAIVFDLGTITDGGWTPSVDESDDNSAWSAVAAADLTGEDAIERTSANDETQLVWGYTGTKRYVRATVTESTASTTGAIFSAVVIGEKRTRS